MGIMPAWYTTTSSKKRKKLVHRTADSKRRNDANKENWQKLLKKYEVKGNVSKPEVYTSNIKYPIGREDPKIPSYSSGVGVATKSDSKKYTGNKMIGIGTLHKSNAVPIFSDSDAKDIAKMRR